MVDAETLGQRGALRSLPRLHLGVQEPVRDASRKLGPHALGDEGVHEVERRYAAATGHARSVDDETVPYRRCSTNSARRWKLRLGLNE